MPKSILIHIGCDGGPFITTTRPPKWMEECVKQYFTFNDDDLYILTDQENIPYLPKHNKIIPVAIEDYYSDKIARFQKVYDYDHTPRGFWTVGVTRLIYLEKFLEDNDLRHVYHFENDVLVYFNIAEYHSIFQRLYHRLASTPDAYHDAGVDFIYVDNYKALADMTDFFIAELTQHGERGLIKKYGTGSINDMILLCEYQRANEDCMAYLPILPFGEFSQGFDEFGAIFDPLRWGQFVGGTRWGKPPGNHFPHTYIGQVLEANPNYTVVWKAENGLRCPYLSYAGNLAKINNLHIHTKNLASFMSAGEIDSSDAYPRKLGHNYHELTMPEKRRYHQIDREQFSPSERFFFEGSLPIPGQMYRADRGRLYDTILKYKPAHCLEIGTGYGGGSTFFLTSAFAKLGMGKVVTSETSKTCGAQSNYRQYLPELLPFVEFLTGGDPALFMPFIEDNAGCVECVFLDGAEDAEQTIEQYKFFKPFFKSGSILMAHDWNTEKMRLLRPIIEADRQWSIEVVLNAPESAGFIVAIYQG